MAMATATTASAAPRPTRDHSRDAFNWRGVLLSPGYRGSVVTVTCTVHACENGTGRRETETERERKSNFFNQWEEIRGRRRGRK